MLKSKLDQVRKSLQSQLSYVYNIAEELGKLNKQDDWINRRITELTNQVVLIQAVLMAMEGQFDLLNTYIQSVEQIIQETDTLIYHELETK